MGTDLLFVFLYLLLGIGSFPFFISTTEHEVTRAFRNANRARVTSQLFFAPREASTPVYFSFFFSSFSSCLCTKLK